jgi:hypothetical protein
MGLLLNVNNNPADLPPWNPPVEAPANASTIIGAPAQWDEASLASELLEVAVIRGLQSSRAFLYVCNDASVPVLSVYEHGGQSGATGVTFTLDATLSPIIRLQAVVDNSSVDSAFVNFRVVGRNLGW